VGEQAVFGVAVQVGGVEGVVVDLGTAQQRGVEADAGVLNVVHHVVEHHDPVLGVVRQIDAVLGHIVNEVVVEVDVVGGARAVGPVDVDLEAVAASDVLDEVVGDLVGAVPIDVDAVTLPGAALDVVDVVAEPDRAAAVAGDAGHARHARAGGGSGGGGQVVVDHAPVMAVDLLADRPVIALAVDAQVADHRPLAHARIGLTVDRGDATHGLAAGEGAVDVGVLGRIAHHDDGAGAGGAGGGAAGLVAEAHEVVLKAHVGPGGAGAAQHDEVPRL